MIHIKVCILYSAMGVLMTSDLRHDLLEKKELRDLRDHLLTLSRKVKELASHSNHHLTRSFDEVGGSVFIHWGRKDCTAGSITIYTGHIAVTHFEGVHAPTANLVCLGRNDGNETDETTAAHLYGVYYGVLGKNHVTALCTACSLPSSAYLMIPMRSECPERWTKQYHGYLMTGVYNHSAATESICVDSEMVSDESNESDEPDEPEHGGRMVLVEHPCNGGPCGNASPRGGNITCVVCVQQHSTP